MKDDNYGKPENDNFEEVPVFSDRDLEDYLNVGEEHSSGGGMQREMDPPPQTLASLKRQRRSRRSFIFVALICFGLGILVLAIFFVMKPEVKKPQIVAKRMKRRIPSMERVGGSAIPGEAGKREMEEKPLEGGIPELEKPSVPRRPEAPLVSRERGAEKKVVIIGGTEAPKRGEENKVIGAEKEGPDTQGRGETKPQFAKVEGPKIRGIPERKLPIGRFTVNIGSFRERTRAERLMNELKAKGYKAFVAEATIPQKGTWYRVSLGRFPSRKEAQTFARAVKEKEGIDFFVRELREVKK
ncbi:MAG: SPOR domain-containing protein [Thermodesulfobacteriota bacterium]